MTGPAATLLDLDVPVALVGTTAAERRDIAIALQIRGSGAVWCVHRQWDHGCGMYPDLSHTLPWVRALEASA